MNEKQILLFFHCVCLRGERSHELNCLLSYWLSLDTPHPVANCRYPLVSLEITSSPLKWMGLWRFVRCMSLVVWTGVNEEAKWPWPLESVASVSITLQIRGVRFTCTAPTRSPLLHIYTCIYTYIYIYICVCVCVCMYLYICVYMLKYWC